MKDYLKMLKALIFVFLAAQIVQTVLSHKKKTEEQSQELPHVTTDRLSITPMCGAELSALIEETDKTDKETADAYRDMLNGAAENPDKFLWYTAWKITSKESGEMLGDLCFKGMPENRQPEIGYGIIEKFRCNGYATEAVYAMCKWALDMQNAAAVEAETAPDNETSQRVLTKVGFIPTGESGKEGPRFILKKNTACEN